MSDRGACTGWINDGTGLEIAPSAQNLKDQHAAPLDAANHDMRTTYEAVLFEQLRGDLGSTVNQLIIRLLSRLHP